MTLAKTMGCRGRRTSKNQRLQGTITPPSVGCGFCTDVVIGSIIPPGHVVQTGKGVVVVFVSDDVFDGVEIVESGATAGSVGTT